MQYAAYKIMGTEKVFWDIRLWTNPWTESCNTVEELLVKITVVMGRLDFRQIKFCPCLIEYFKVGLKCLDKKQVAARPHDIDDVSECQSLVSRVQEIDQNTLTNEDIDRFRP